jgi:outer membrane receptor protein involved in Fe transport
MMMQKLLSTILILFVSISFAFAQEGTIRGTIKDTKSKEDLVGATVFLEGHNKGGAADINGFFSLSHLPVGTYKLRISFVGYKSKFIENVRVLADQVTEVNTFLDEEGSTLNEVKVIGQKLTNTEISVISEIKAAQQIVSGISAAQISKTLDRNAAEVVKRVPGVTIFGDRFINIRGLNERYNTVMLNNTFTPSMESDVRSFSFDIIPSNQIDRILVFKSPAAELPGEFAGGVVKIFTKTIPDQNSLTVDYGTSFRSGTTNQTFFTPQSGDLAWTGFNQGFSDLPKYFPSTDELKNIALTNPQRLQQVGQSLKNSWTPVQSNAIPDQRLAITGAFKTNLGNVKIGNVTAVNYSNTRTNFTKVQNDYGYSSIEKTGKADELSVFNDQQYTNAIRVGFLHNWAFKLSDNHTIEFKNLYNQLSNAQYIDRNGFENGANWQIKSFNQNYRGIYTGQLLGRHNFNDGKTKIDWVAGYNQSYNQLPDYKRFRYSSDGKLVVPQGAVQTFNLGRTNINLDEKAITGGVNLVQKLTIQKGTTAENSKEIELKAGAYYEVKDRTFNARNLGYVQSNSSLFNIGSLPIDQIFAPQNINTTNGVKIDEQTNKSDAYTAKNSLLAVYASGNYSFSKKFNVIAGVRIESNAQKLNGYDNRDGKAVSPNIDVTSVLPSINVSYNFSEKSLLRLAYGKTLNRPEFREIAPFTFYDFVLNRVVTGNPNLQNAKVDNYDFRYEFYPTPSEIISIAAFYKDFTTPIEVVFTSSSNPNVSFDNAQSAYSTGIELEIRKSLEPVTTNSFLNKINILFNASLIYSRVKLKPEIAANQSDNRPLQGQSPYVINGGLNYNNQKTRLQVNLLYNVIGKRIYAVGNNFGALYPDWYEMPRNILDLTFSKGITKNLVIKGGITDILNQKALILQDGNQDGTYSKDNDQTIQSYSPGSVYSLGVVYTFQK